MLDDVFAPRKRLAGTAEVGVPFSAVVTQSNANGVWCTRQGEDSRNSLGPVENPTRDVVRLTSDGHYHEKESLPVGLPVVLVNTVSGLWVIAHGG